MTKLRTGRELRADANALLTTVAKHVNAAATKQPAVSAKPADRSARLRAAEADVRAKSDPVTRPASRSALAADTEAAVRRKAIAVADAIRKRFNEHRR